MADMPTFIRSNPRCERSDSAIASASAANPAADTANLFTAAESLSVARAGNIFDINNGGGGQYRYCLPPEAPGISKTQKAGCGQDWKVGVIGLYSSDHGTWLPLIKVVHLQEQSSHQTAGQLGARRWHHLCTGAADRGALPGSNHLGAAGCQGRWRESFLIDAAAVSHGHQALGGRRNLN